MDALSPEHNEASANTNAQSFARQVRPWFVILLTLQALLLVIRWHLGDAHGALLMFAVCAVGTLALTVGTRGVDEVYGGYFGLMALVSGLLDLNLAVEHLLWGEWKSLHGSKVTLASLAKPAMYLLCASVQLLSAFVAYLLYKDAEVDGELDVHEPVFATPDQARIYNAVLGHSDRHSLSAQAQAARLASADPVKAFNGNAHKLS